MHEIYKFDNGVKVYDYHLTSRQCKRYKELNIHEPVEEKIFLEIISSMPPISCFVSIGSAIGYYPILAKKIKPDLKIYAFDPLKIHKKYFLENIDLNGFSSEDFVIYEKALSLDDGIEYFLEQTFGSVIINRFQVFKPQIYFKAIVKKILTICRIKEFQVGYSKVETISLNSMMKIINSPIELLQMDIQGLEADVLNGGVKTLQSHYIKKFLIGTHGLKIHEKCINTLIKYNYIIQFENNELESQPDGIILAISPAKAKAGPLP